MTDADSLSLWRQFSEPIAHTPAAPGTGTGQSEHLRRKQEQLASLCLTSVAVHRQYVVDLKAAITNGNTLEDPELQQLVEDYGALALGEFTQKSAKALRMSMEKALDEGAVVIVRPVHPPVPQQKSLLERMVGRLG